MDTPSLSTSSPPARSFTQSIHATWADIKTYRRAYILTIVASFGGLLFGWDTGLIGGVLTMDAFKHSFGLDTKHENYANVQGNIVSVLQGGCFFGAASSFWLGDKLGRKWSLILADTVFIIGSLVQTLCAIKTTSLTQLYIGRFIGGWGVGCISAIVPIYIGENVNKEIRGRCIGCMQLFNVTGIMTSYFVNYGISKHMSGLSDLKWRVPFALQMAPGLLLLLLVFQNESPRWLVEKNRIEEAQRSLTIVRGKSKGDAAVMQELQEIIDDFNGHERLTILQQLRAVVANKKIFYRASFAVILMFWQQSTGTNSINYYSPQIFSSIGIQGASAGLFATGIYGVVKVVFTGLGMMLATEQLGRKYCLILGAMGQAFSMYYIGINQAIHPTVPGAPLTGHNTFAIICVYLFVVFYSFSWGPIPYVLSSECAPNHVRSLIMALALMTQWLINFIIAKITPIMLADISYGTFLIFGSCCLLSLFYSILCVPETKGVPLESIHELFEDGSIVRGCLRDMVPKRTRALGLRQRAAALREAREDGCGEAGNGVGNGVGSINKSGLVTVEHA
ncbi:general substrate transporter [Pseudovirgaria hyperparasitica]|uniref:General substrate transporter n=1 Tax=Pseudovirgaria hyperparasitica TaxID=470096 RepID=A0A6A6WB29_9PEZI|nr:general substrate transporter [Pseudovirgaria hyperparasitica]KAF2759046.1 general substrate transporter [Pseudovirgaria hyperparasitica]